MREMEISTDGAPTRTGEEEPLGLTLRRWQWAVLVTISGIFMLLHVRFTKGDLSETARSISSGGQEDVVISALGKASREQVCDLTSFKADWKQWPVVLPTDLLMPHPKAVHYKSTPAEETVHRIIPSTAVKFSIPHLSDEAQTRQLRHSLSTFCRLGAGLKPLSGSYTVVEIIVAENSVYDDMHNACTQRGQEAFNLTMLGPRHIKIAACSVSAAALAVSSTMSQLFAPGVVLGVPALPYTIEDYPKYHWRGLMVDVSRHFQPIALLKRCVDAMQLSKLNVLHLHLTDAQSFPLALEDRPGLPLSMLANKGSWDGTKVYKKSDLEALVFYAQLRGIEIIPEVDVPAHTFAWSKAFPDIVVNCSHRASVSQTPMDIYALDPSNPVTYAVVEEIYDQLAAIFPSKYMHIGGDEVDVRCWKESASLQEWARAQGNLTESDLFAGFVNKTVKHVRSLGKIPISWQGVIDSGVLPEEYNIDHGSVVQPWKCWSGLAVRASNSAVKSNHPVVMSSCWYLDYDEDWLSMMSVDQLATAMSQRPASKAETRLALGGEGAMWTERVDHTNLECRMWPRAAAIASRLWGLSEALIVQTQNSAGYNILQGQAALLDLKTSKSLLISLVHFRHMLTNLGVRASPVVFHKNVRFNASAGVELIPEGYFWNEQEAIEVIRSQVKIGLTMSSNSKLQPSLTEGAYRLTCKCLTASKNMAVQRPHHMNDVHIAQLNIADGRLGPAEHPLLDWFLQKANEGVLLIGLCEINNWHKLKSSTDVNKNVPYIEFYASQSGFTYSHVMVNAQPYNLGIISSVAFDVYGEYGQPDFQRGLLHIYVKTLDLHVMVLHLHAHSSELRTLECQKVASILLPFIANNSRVVLMGDMNTLSPLDASQHKEMGLLDSLRRKTHEVWMRLAKKYLTVDQLKIDYEPMTTILATGMLDSCAVGCNFIEGNTNENTWSMKGGSAFATCMQRQCAATEPTKYSSEWPKLPGNEKHPFVRLDYILVSPAVIRDAQVSQLGVLDNKKFNAFVEVTNDTEHISDHFPMEVRWAEKDGYDLF